MIAVGTLVFVVLAWQVHGGSGLIQLDQSITGWMQAHREPALQAPLFVVTHVHSTWGIVILGVLLGALLTWQRRWRALAFLCVGLGGGMLVNVALKLAFARARPLFDDPVVSLTTYSFPSGHAASSTLLYMSAIIVFAHTRWQRLAIAIGCALVVLTAFSRVYLGAHYLSDVVAGICVGLVWVHACRLLLDTSLRR
jgi:undecaprenyl-diphosphatase